MDTQWPPKMDLVWNASSKGASHPRRPPLTLPPLEVDFDIVGRDALFETSRGGSAAFALGEEEALLVDGLYDNNSNDELDEDELEDVFGAVRPRKDFACGETMVALREEWQARHKMYLNDCLGYEASAETADSDDATTTTFGSTSSSIKCKHSEPAPAAGKLVSEGSVQENGRWATPFNVSASLPRARPCSKVTGPMLPPLGRLSRLLRSTVRKASGLTGRASRRSAAVWPEPDTKAE